jgi:hypothetical protein
MGLQYVGSSGEFGSTLQRHRDPATVTIARCDSQTLPSRKSRHATIAETFVTKQVTIPIAIIWSTEIGIAVDATGLLIFFIWAIALLGT